MRIKLRKLWKGREASIKDIEIQEAKKKNEPIILEYKGMTMTVTDYSKFKPSGTVVKSKINPNQKYELCDIDWAPDEEEAQCDKCNQNYPEHHLGQYGGLTLCPICADEVHGKE